MQESAQICQKCGWRLRIEGDHYANSSRLPAVHADTAMFGIVSMMAGASPGHTDIAELVALANKRQVARGAQNRPVSLPMAGQLRSPSSPRSWSVITQQSE